MNEERVGQASRLSLIHVPSASSAAGRETRSIAARFRLVGFRDRRDACPACFKPGPRLLWALLFLVGLLSTFPLAAQTPSFSRDLAPILLQKCVICHGPEKQKANYRLDTFDALLKAGASKAAPIVPGQPEQSHLFQLLVTKDADDRMPQKDDPLPAAQIALVRRWITDGAAFDGASRTAPLSALIPKAAHPAPPAAYPRPVPALALDFSRDGSELAVSGYHEITIWNPADGQLLRRLTNIAQRTQSLAYSPDGTVLAAASGNPGQSGEVTLLDPRRGTILKTLASLPDLALDVKFSPDGTRLAAAGADNSIRIFDVATGAEERRIDQHADWVMAVAWSPDGTHLASASRDRSSRVFELKTGKLEQSYFGHTAPVFTVAFSGDGKEVITGGRDRKIHFWAAAKDAKKRTEIAGFTNDVLRLLVAEGQVFSASADHSARQHDSKAELVRDYAGHTDWVYSVALHPATQRLATGGFAGSVRVWSTADGRLLHTFTAAPGWTETAARRKY